MWMKSKNIVNQKNPDIRVSTLQFHLPEIVYHTKPSIITEARWAVIWGWIYVCVEELTTMNPKGILWDNTNFLYVDYNNYKGIYTCQSLSNYIL